MPRGAFFPSCNSWATKSSTWARRGATAWTTRTSLPRWRSKWAKPGWTAASFCAAPASACALRRTRSPGFAPVLALEVGEIVQIVPRLPNVRWRQRQRAGCPRDQVRDDVEIILNVSRHVQAAARVQGALTLSGEFLREHAALAVAGFPPG